MTGYIKRLLDATDDGADLLSLAIAVGVILALLAGLTFIVLIVAQTFWPAHVHFDGRAFIAGVVGFGGFHTAVVGSATAAHRLRWPQGARQSAAGGGSAR